MFVYFLFYCQHALSNYQEVLWKPNHVFFENLSLAWPIWKIPGELRQLMLPFVSLACSFALDEKKRNYSQRTSCLWGNKCLYLIVGCRFFSWSKSIGGAKSRTWKESGRVREETGSGNQGTALYCYKDSDCFKYTLK